MSISVCDCYENGYQICDISNGDCYCNEGYNGTFCYQCADGYYDSNSGTTIGPISGTPNCLGKIPRYSLKEYIFYIIFWV